MDSKLLDYYNRELAYLREMGAEFAERYPKRGRTAGECAALISPILTLNA